MAMKQAVAYYCVSTKRQGESGLGLEAQRSSVNAYCFANEIELVSEIIEIKSTRKGRQKLFQALELCRKTKATLIVAKLDRLGRDVEQIAGIVKLNIEIIVTDNPHANRFTIHILAAVAEEHRMRISETTKEALQAAKQRGIALGKNGKNLATVNKQAAIDFAWKVSPIIMRLKTKGIVSVRAVSCELNRRRVPTFTGGGRWHPSSVSILIRRLKEAETKS